VTKQDPVNYHRRQPNQYNIAGHTLSHGILKLSWPPCVADVDIIFFVLWFLLSSILFSPRLISAVADSVSTIHLHMVCS